MARPQTSYLAALALLVSGCSSVKLVPVAAAAPGLSVAASSGVEVRADTRAAAPSAVPPNLTPVRLSVTNRSDRPVYVQLQDIELHGPSHELSAVPPRSIEPRHRIASLGLDPASPFVVEQSVEGVGPHAGRTESVLLEPGIGTGTAPTYAPGKTDRARAELLESSFEGGAIQSGQTREGFIYFRQLPEHADRLTLQVGVRPAPDHAPATVLQIPYTTTRG
jgi:hypothetical protein